MQLGIGLPTLGAHVTPAAIVAIARGAEDLGFDSVWAGERFLRPLVDVPFLAMPPAPVPESYGYVYDALQTLGHVAAVTERVTLGTSVLNALLHPPLVLAKRLATLDQLSGGRVVAGLGQGWIPQEFEAVNVPFDRIGDGMDDVVAVLRACWGPDPVSIDGAHHSITPSAINPKPAQAHLPILLGAITPAGVRRAVRIADGLNPMVFSKEMLLGLMGLYRAELAAAGREPSSAPIVARINLPITAAPIEQDRPPFGGSPAQIIDDLTELAEAGLDGVILDDQTGAPPEDLLPLLEQIRKAF